MRRSPMPPRKRRMRAVSDKRKTMEAVRAVVVEQVTRRDKTCVAAQLVPDVPCRGHLAVHEVIQRSVWPAGFYEADNCVLVCRAHHMWAHDNIEAARAVGLIRDSWERP